jgi:hypothetical protein
MPPEQHVLGAAKDLDIAQNWHARALEPDTISLVQQPKVRCRCMRIVERAHIAINAGGE